MDATALRAFDAMFSISPSTRALRVDWPARVWPALNCLIEVSVDHSGLHYAVAYQHAGAETVMTPEIVWATRNLAMLARLYHVRNMQSA